MLEINRLKDYIDMLKESLRDEAGNTIFNYTTIVLDSLELSSILQERKSKENSFLITVMPQFDKKGGEDASKWNNSLMFFILDKTDYSEKNRDGYINIFIETQKKAQAFVDKFLIDKSDNQGMFCSFLSWLKEDSISVNPVWKNNGCNGWSVEISLETV